MTDVDRPRRGITRRLTLGAATVAAGVVLAVVPVPQMQWASVAGLDTILPGALDASAETPPPLVEAESVVVEATDVEEFEMVGLRLRERTDAPLSIRVRPDGGEWGEWMEAEVPSVDEGPDPGSAEAVASDAGVVTEPIWVGAASSVQVAGPDEVTSAAEVLVVREELRRTAVDTVESAGAAGPVAANAPVIRSRSEWGARPTPAPSVAKSIELGVVHHTASASDYSAASVPGILRGIQAFHIDGNGWSDIGYNYLVDRFGQIWEGRGGGTTTNVVGAHAAGFNTGSFGVSVIGSFDSSAPTQASVNAVSQLVGWRMYLADRDPFGSTTFVSGGSSKYAAGTSVALPRVIGHRDVGLTGCPGGNLYARLGEIRSGAKATYDLLSVHDPRGEVPNRSVGSGRIGLGGWAIDPDTGGPIEVVAEVDGQPSGTARVTQLASAPWPGLGFYFPLQGDNHGFTVYVPSVSGRKNVCVTAVNVGPGRDRRLFCGTFVVSDGTPEGRLDSWYGAAGKVTVTGRVVDPDASGAVGVTVQLGGQPGGVVSRSVSANPTFSATFDAVPGTHDLCAYATNRNEGRNATLGCAKVTVRSGSPFGTGEPAGNPPGGVSMSGWAIDPDTIGPVQVVVRLDGQPGGTREVRTLANGRWPALSRGYPGYGDDHRFAVTIPAVKGTHNLCAYAVNQGPGTDTALSCQRVTVVK